MASELGRSFANVAQLATLTQISQQQFSIREMPRALIQHPAMLEVKHGVFNAATAPLVSSKRREVFYMQEPDSVRPVLVTGQERAHPALRTLARACIAIAREAITRSSGIGPSEATTGNATEEASGTPRREGAHD